MSTKRFKDMTPDEQAAYRASFPRPKALPRRTAAVRSRVEDKPDAAPRRDEEPRDGLAWLLKKKKLNKAEQYECGRFRAGYREDGDGVLGSPVCTEGGVRGAAGGKEMALVAMSDARREYLYIVSHVLRGVDDLRTVMDGVVGRGYTLRFLADDNQLRQAMLENSLHIALALIIAWRADLKVRVDAANKAA